MRKLTLREMQDVKSTLAKINEAFDENARRALNDALKDFSDLADVLGSKTLKLITQEFLSSYKKVVKDPRKMRALSTSIAEVVASLHSGMTQIPMVFEAEQEFLQSNWKGLPVIKTLLYGTINRKAQELGVRDKNFVDSSIFKEEYADLVKVLMDPTSISYKDLMKVLDNVNKKAQAPTDSKGNAKSVGDATTKVVTESIKSFKNSVNDLYSAFRTAVSPKEVRGGKVGKWLANIGVDVGGDFPKFMSDDRVKALFIEMISRTSQELSDLAIKLVKATKKDVEVFAKSLEEIPLQQTGQQQTKAQDTAKDVAAETGIDVDVAKSITDGIVQYLKTQGGKISGEKAIEQMAVAIAKNLKR